MAHIVEFRSNAVRAEPETEATQGGGGAQIIIFPGVRIDRHAAEETPGGTVTSSRKGTQRSRKKQRR